MDPRNLNLAAILFLTAAVACVQSPLLAQDLVCSVCDDEAGCSCCCDCACCPWLYASLNLRGSFDDLESGGRNTEGRFRNTGGDETETFSVAGALGIAVPARFGTIRLECEGMWVDPFVAETNSYRPPTPFYFYQVDRSDQWAVLANLWYDVPLNRCLDFYLGAGVGGGGATLSVTDGVVEGGGSSTDVVWQVGCGLTRSCSNRISIDLGYRYMDFGTQEENLEGLILAGPAGNYTADVTSHQLFLGIRYDNIGDLLRR